MGAFSGPGSRSSAGCPARALNPWTRSPPVARGAGAPARFSLSSKQQPQTEQGAQPSTRARGALASDSGPHGDAGPSRGFSAWSREKGQLWSDVPGWAPLPTFTRFCESTGSLQAECPQLQQPGPGGPSTVSHSTEQGAHTKTSVRKCASCGHGHSPDKPEGSVLRAGRHSRLRRPVSKALEATVPWRGAVWPPGRWKALGSAAGHTSETQPWEGHRACQTGLLQGWRRAGRHTATGCVERGLEKSRDRGRGGGKLG